MLDKVLKDLRHMARIGVEEAYRVPSTSSNAPSAIECGEEVIDSLLDWIEDGYVIEPFDWRNCHLSRSNFLG